MSYTELCKSDKSDNIYFTQEEVSKICSAIIDSPVDTTRELQDKVLKVLQLKKQANSSACKRNQNL